MPQLVDALDANRYREIAHDAQLGGNLWLTLALAAQRGDKHAVDAACGQIRTLTTATFALVKKLGSEDGSNG